MASQSVSTSTVLGTLNRLRPSLSVPSYSALNVTARALGDDGLQFDPEGDAASLIDQLAGRVVSAAPYMGVSIGIPLVRTTPLAAAWWAQLMSNAAIGDVQLTTDTSAFPVIYVQNCVIRTPGSQRLNGRGPLVPISISGTLIINSALWAAA